MSIKMKKNKNKLIYNILYVQKIRIILKIINIKTIFIKY